MPIRHIAEAATWGDARLGKRLAGGSGVETVGS